MNIIIKKAQNRALYEQTLRAISTFVNLKRRFSKRASRSGTLHLRRPIYIKHSIFLIVAIEFAAFVLSLIPQPVAWLLINHQVRFGVFQKTP